MFVEGDAGAMEIALLLGVPLGLLVYLATRKGGA